MTAPKRRWFRFSLRTLFVVVTVVGIACSWALSQKKWIRDRSEAMNWVQSQRAWNLANGRSTVRLPLGLRLFGERFALDAIEVREADTRSDDAFSIAELKRLFPEATVEATTDRRLAPH